MQTESHLRPLPDLHEVHQKLRALYDRDYPDGAPHLYEHLLRPMSPYIQALVRRKLALLVQEETGEPKSDEDLSNGDKHALAIFLDAQVLRAHLEVGRDSALSNDTHLIPHIDTQPLIMTHHLIAVASSEHPETLQRTGCVFFDVDGTKTIVDCTSHAHTGKYLEGLAEFLCKPPAPVQRWLSERSMRAEAYSVAGDEFIVILHSDQQSLDEGTLDAFAQEVQKAMTADPYLSSIVSFDDLNFIMEYDDWTDEDRAAYKRDPLSMQERLRASRSKLPDKFTPSVSCGSATLLEALHEALSPDTEEAENLKALGIDVFRLMTAHADARLKEAKRIFRENMTDPKWRAFLLRNAENRRLMNEIETLRSQYAHALERIRILEETIQKMKK